MTYIELVTKWEFIFVHREVCVLNFFIVYKIIIHNYKQNV